MIKAVNFLRILSVILFLAVLTFTYAFMPVMVNIDPGDRSWLIHKERFFYYSLGIFFLVNVLVTLLQNLANPGILARMGEEITAWFSSIGFILNVYLALVVGFLGVLNNPGSMAASHFMYLNFLGPILIFIWIFGLIYFVIMKKRTT